MIRKPRTRPEPLHPYFLLLIAILAAPSFADEYLDARAELIAAYQEQDFAAMQAAGERALAARPGHAGALYNLALAQVLNGNRVESLDTLKKLLAQKVDFSIADAEEFAPLKSLPEWNDYVVDVATIYEPIGDPQIVATYDKHDFIPEGIAVSDDGSVYLGSIRHGSIVRLGESPRVISEARDGPHWSVYGMRLANDLLWYVSSAIDQFAVLAESDRGRTGLFAIDTENGRIVTRALLPPTGRDQVLGDLVVLDDDTILLADQLDGIVYRYSVPENSFSVLVEKGVIGSPQGLVLDASGQYLYVADYIGGLFRVALKDGNVAGVGSPSSINTYGIDGLYRHGNRLIAIQNGVRPNRVVAFELAEDGLSIRDSEILAMNLDVFDEPNLGQVIDDRFVFIANSHWNRFDPEGNLPEDINGPVVVAIDLSDD